MMPAYVTKGFFCVTEFTLDATFSLASGEDFTIKAIKQIDEVTATLGHSLTLDTEQIILHVLTAEITNIDLNAMAFIESKPYQIIKSFSDDGITELLLCPR